MISAHQIIYLSACSVLSLRGGTVWACLYGDLPAVAYLAFIMEFFVGAKTHQRAAGYDPPRAIPRVRPAAVVYAMALQCQSYKMHMHLVAAPQTWRRVVASSPGRDGSGEFPSRYSVAVPFSRSNTLVGLRTISLLSKAAGSRRAGAAGAALRSRAAHARKLDRAIPAEGPAIAGSPSTTRQLPMGYYQFFNTWGAPQLVQRKVNRMLGPGNRPALSGHRP